MTRFVDVQALSRIVDRVGIETFFEGLTATLVEDFRRWEEFEKCARLASHSDVGVIELMPVADEKQYAFKYVNGHPSNPGQDLSTVMAFGALVDVRTGYPQLLSELTLTTAFRTAATSAMAASALARPESRIMGLIGCGAQGEFQAIAFHKLLGIDQLHVFDIDSDAMKKLERHLQRFPGLRVERTESPQQAVRGADIVTTVTADKAWATILTADMVEPGMHINALGGDCPGKTELHEDVLRMSKVFVEYEPQTRIEGDIQQMPADFQVQELWQVLNGQAEGRESEQQVTVFDSVGFALEDYSALRYVYQLARTLGEGMTIELVPELGNPKDLFELVAQAQAKFGQGTAA